MAKKHNKATIDLEKSKIKDHLKMMKKARMGGEIKSAAYHESHAKDNKKTSKLARNMIRK